MRTGELKGVGAKREAELAAAGIFTSDDLLAFYPMAFEDWTNVRKIREVVPGEKCCVVASVVKMRTNYLRKRGNMMLRVTVADGETAMDIVIFNARQYNQQAFGVGRIYAFFGSIYQDKMGLPQMVNPAYEEMNSETVLSIRPVYHTIKGISQKMFRNLVKQALEITDEIPETLPDSIIEKNKLCSRDFALRNIHFPIQRKAYNIARYRLVFEELFFLQTGLFMRANSRCRQETGVAFRRDDSLREFAELLGYEMTGAQKRVLREIELDMESAVPMQRLVQGDVGSGKTAVAAAALYKAAKAGYQGVLMAPTELLASQHFESFSRVMDGTGVRVGFLSSRVSKAERKHTLEALAEGSIDILIGTHSVIQEDVKFANLGLVITDEQHRFGVNQRRALAEKGNGRDPDVLVMTATPIPRTLAVIMFGEMDISVIDELPPGRQPVDTVVKPLTSRASVYKAAGKQLEQGRQVYAVAPLVADSEVMDVMSSETLYEDLKKRFKGYTVGLVNGSMKQEEKDAVMAAFSEGKIQILAATVVIEVGINVPNATVMIIENAERFGLAQLHQLRGRVGRGSGKSCCVLLTDKNSELGMERANTIAGTGDGFRIAEMDLTMRGPGDFFGTRQHGLPTLHMADLTKHMDILDGVREDVKEILQADPSLTAPENSMIARGVENMFGKLDAIGL